jgi:hypothetical protein
MTKLEELEADVSPRIDVSPGVDEYLNRTATDVGDYLDAAVAKIDGRFGRGYASEHPELIAAFMQTCAIESTADTLEREISYLTKTIAQAIREIVT